MAKKEGVKKRVRVKKNLKNSNSYNKKLLALTIGVFVVLSFALMFVSVGNGGVSFSPLGDAWDVLTGDKVATDSSSWGEFWDGWEKGEMDLGILKYGFFIFVSILIFSGLHTANWPENDAFKWLIALPIGFVSVGVLSIPQIASVLTTYGALSLTLLVAGPLAAMFFFSSQFLQGRLTVGKVIIQLILWYFYLGFLLYLSWNTLSTTGTDKGIIVIILLGAVFLTSLIIFKNKWFREWVRNMGRWINEDATKDIVAGAQNAQQQAQVAANPAANNF